MTFMTVRTAARGLLLATAIAGAVSPGSALADGAVRAAAIAPSGFNWLSNGAQLSQEELEALILARQLRHNKMGDGTWICSPAGFGQRSHCFRR